MSRTESRWADEEAWWTMGAAEARRRMHPSCVMVLDGGVMQGEAILAALETAPRWSSVAMADRLTVETEECTVLAYRAEARRGDDDYAAVCSSTWVRQNEGWQLIQHQQTPLPR